MKASNGWNMPGHDATNGLGEAMSEATQKVALVTGSARGIGLATAKRFLADGWRVVLLDIDGENLKRTFTALNKPDVTLALVCDVADPAGDARGIGDIAYKCERDVWFVQRCESALQILAVDIEQHHAPAVCEKSLGGRQSDPTRRS